MTSHCRVHIIASCAALAFSASAVEYVNPAVDNPVPYIVKTSS